MSFFGDLIDAIRNPPRRRIEREAVALSQADADRRNGLGVTPDMGGGSPRENNDLSRHLEIDRSMKERYAEYERMADYSDVATALDIYADEATVPRSEDNASIWFWSSDSEIADKGNRWLKYAIKSEDIIWPFAREFCMFGAIYGEPIVHESHGVVAIRWIPAPQIRPVYDVNGALLCYIQDPSKTFDFNYNELIEHIKAGRKVNLTGAVVFEPHMLIHWKLTGRSLSAANGMSILEPARWMWRRLIMLEDMMLAAKIAKSNSRLVYYVNVGKLGGTDKWKTVNDYIQRFKRRKFIDANGRVQWTKDSMAVDEDIFLPVESDADPTRIDQLPGTDFQQMEPVLHYDGKFKGALKLHASRFGYGADSDPGKTQNATQDIQFARAIMRVQRGVRVGFNQLFAVHLICNGVDPEHPDLEYDARMEIPSYILEIARREVESARLDVMMRYKEFADTVWILQKIGGFTKEEAEEMKSGWLAERKELAKLDTDTEVDRFKAMNVAVPQEQTATITAKQAAKLEEAWSKTLASNKALSERVRALRPLLIEIQSEMRSKPRRIR